MKKKIGIILAVLLLVSLVFTFVACGTDGAKSINGVTAEQITEKYAEVEAFLDSWVRSNSQETITNQSDALKNSLKAAAKESLAFVDGDQNLVKPSYTVSFDKKTSKYTVALDWGNGAVKKTFVVAAKTPEYANWAGKGSNAADYTRIDSEDAASSNLNALIEAMAYSVNEVTSQSVTGKFSVDTIIGLDVMGFNYGLRVKANIDTASAANTQVGLILVNEDKEELGGLFYEGAETVAESKIYIEYSTVEDDVRSYSYKWIDYADILGFVKKILPETKDQPGKGIFEEVYEGDEGEYYENAVEGLGDLLGLFGVGMGDLIEGILDMVAHGYESADGNQLLVDIDLGEVMANITDMIADFGIDTSKLPDFLGDIGLDLNTMHGLRGHISISGKIDNDGDTPKLVDFELAVNIPKDTVFYLSADESADGVKIEIPAISFALYLNDFAFFTDEEIDVIPAAAKEATQDGSGYFSPTNLDVSGNVYIKHVEGTETVLDDTFAFEFVTDINPLEIIQNKFDSAAKAGLKITQYQGKGTTGVSSNFLTITYEQNLRLLCVSGTAFGLDDGNKVYTFEMTDKDEAIAEIKKWLGLDNWQGIALEDEDGNPGLYIVYTGEGDEKTTIAKASAQAVLENALAKSLTRYFMEKKAAENTAGAEFNPGDITDYFDRIMDIFDTLTEQGVIAIDGDAGSVAIHVTPDVINMVTAAINGIFKTELPTDITDPEKANIDFNTTGYEGKLFIDVKYAGNTYSLLFDGSKDDSFVITFTLTLASGRTYTVSFDGESNVDTTSGTKWTASVTVEIKNADGSSDTSTEVTLSNFHAEWGNNNEEEVGEIITFNKGLTAGGSIFNADGTGPATNLAGGLMKILNSEAIVDYVDSLGKFIIRQIVK